MLTDRAETLQFLAVVWHDHFGKPYYFLSYLQLIAIQYISLKVQFERQLIDVS